MLSSPKVWTSLGLRRSTAPSSSLQVDKGFRIAPCQAMEDDQQIAGFQKGTFSKTLFYEK
jgi:hypothetical protein